MFLSLSLVFSVFFIIQSNSILSLWFSLELNTLLFLFLIKTNSESKFSSEFWVKYFLTQSILSFTFIFFLTVLGSKWHMLSYIILAKMGFPPFHFWVLDLLKSMNPYTFFILSSVQKVPYLMIFSFLGSPSVLIFSLVFLNVFSIFFIFSEMSLLKFLFLSGLNSSMEMLLLSLIFPVLGILWMWVYSILLVFFCNFLSSGLKTKSVAYKTNETLILFVYFSGFPPFSVFFLKLILLTNLLSVSFFVFLFYLANSFLFMFLYIQFFTLSKLILFLDTLRSVKLNLTFTFFLSLWVWNLWA